MSNPAEEIARRAKLAFDQAQQSLGDPAQANKARNYALRKIVQALEKAKARVQQANKEDVEVSVCDDCASQDWSSYTCKVESTRTEQQDARQLLGACVFESFYRHLRLTHLPVPSRPTQAANVQVRAGKLSASLASRLDLFSKAGKWEAMLQGVEDVANLPSPLDICTYAKRLASSPASTSTSTTSSEASEASGAGSLDLYRITCPIGVLLCIFEARPEVVINIASLAIKSGNSAILKGGSESKRTASIMKDIIQEALIESKELGLPQDLIQTVETRQEISELLHQEKYIDLVIPRGGNALVKAIQREARMPVMGHADGLCSAYVHSDAQVEMTVGTIVDSKVSRLTKRSRASIDYDPAFIRIRSSDTPARLRGSSVLRGSSTFSDDGHLSFSLALGRCRSQIDYPAACNSLETLLLHELHLKSGLWPTLAEALLSVNVLLRCDSETFSALSKSNETIFGEAVKTGRIVESRPEDYDTEFLDLELAVKAVSTIDEAIEHINNHGSGHTDTILTAPLQSESSSGENRAAEHFSRAVSSANVFVNASTRFSDGFRYGFGTEVGISTGKTHARGPVGLEGLVIYKYLIRGSGTKSQIVGDFKEGGRSWNHGDIEKKLPRF